MKSFKKYYLKESEKYVDFLNKLKDGFNVEKEHSKTVGDNPITIARIALDHLEEDMDYYEKLKKVEK